MQTFEANPQLLHQILSLIDLTSLNDNDDNQTIKKLCEKADDLVAAICVFPKFVKIAKQISHNSSVKIATVSNFPSGNNSVSQTIAEIKYGLEQGANEIDVVIPYHHYKQNDRNLVQQFLFACREASTGFTLKVILETGELEEELITLACEDVILAHADFIKTSTGKTSIGATPTAAKIILSCIKHHQSDIGIKVSGGIHTVDQALLYTSLATEIMGQKWLHPEKFRIGTSKLFDNIQNILANDNHD